MKRSIVVFVATFFVAGAFAQNNNLFWTIRVDVKMDKRLEWEKKVVTYLKTHYPQFGLRAFEVMTGPNSGSYHFSMGPMAYKDFDVPPVFPKGEEAWKKDGQSLDALTESFEITHYRLVEPISRMRTDRDYKYLRVTFVEITIGAWDQAQEFFAKVLNVREKNNVPMDINFFRPESSGTANRFVIARYVEKMEELDPGENFAEMYDKIYGQNALYKDRQAYLGLVKSISTELWSIRPDLSTVKPLSVSAN